jgi:hypothetical protein
MEEITELLAKAWIECDPNRGGPTDTPLSGMSDELNGKPRWHWFVPRAERLESYLAEHGYKIVSAA